MPGFYAEDEYDLAGFSVGIVDRAEIFDNASVKAGDALIALPLFRRAFQWVLAHKKDIWYFR